MRRRARSPQPLGCGRHRLLQLSAGFAGAAPISCWTGGSLASQQWPVWSQRKRNVVGLYCKEGSQVLDASPSKLEISLFYLGWN